MARRLRLVKPEQQSKSVWMLPGGMGLFIVVCIMMVVLIQMLPTMMRNMDKPPALEPKTVPVKEQTTIVEDLSEKEEETPPKGPLKAYTPLSPADEKALFAKVVDQEPLERDVYFYCLRKINAMTDDQINAALDPSVKYDTFAEAGGPAQARGKIVRLEGFFKHIKETKFKTRSAFESGFDAVWEGCLIDKDLRVIAFHATHRPPEGWLTPDRDSCVAKGIYLKNIVYRNRGGGFTAAPLIIVKNLVKIIPPVAPTTFWSTYKEYFIIAAIILAVAGLTLMEYRRRMRAAVESLPRRRPSEPLVVVPDEQAQAEPAKQEGAEQAPQTSPVSETADKKAEEEKKDDEGEKKGGDERSPT